MGRRRRTGGKKIRRGNCEEEKDEIFKTSK